MWAWTFGLARLTEGGAFSQRTAHHSQTHPVILATLTGSRAWNIVPWCVIGGRLVLGTGKRSQIHIGRLMKYSLLLAGLIAAPIFAAAAPATVKPNPTIRAAVDDLVKAIKRAPATNREADLSIFILNVESGETILAVDRASEQLTYCGSPSWSPDGRRIVFDATPGRNYGQTQIHVIEAANGRAKLTNLRRGVCPTASPDGKRIAFLCHGGVVPGGRPGLSTMRLDGSQREPILVRERGIPKWSPDGNRLLVTSFSSPARLSLVNMANPARPMVDPVLVEGGKVFSVPSWVGDGAIIVAVVQTWASTDVALVDVSNPAKATIKQKLFSKDGRMFPYYPVYHAATKRCVFAGREQDGTQDETALYSFRAGEEHKRIEPEGYQGKIASLAFSPDGRYVLFCSEQAEQE